MTGMTRGVATAVPAPSTTCPLCPTQAVCTPKPDCPSGFQRLPGILTKCYRATGSDSSYYQAEAACYAMGGNLAEFANAAEQAAVQTFVNGLGRAHYVGYNEFEMVLTLVGDDSRATPFVAFTGFSAGQDCGTLNANATPTAVDCTTALPGICEARTDPAVVRCVCA